MSHVYINMHVLMNKLFLKHFCILFQIHTCNSQQPAMSSFVLILVILTQCVSAAGKRLIIISLLILCFAVLLFQCFSIQTQASVVEICAGDNYTLTCVTDTGTLVWYRVGGLTKTFSSVTPNVPSSLGDHITVYPTNVSGSVITSVANITRAPLALNRTVIQCRDSSYDGAVGEVKACTLLISGKTNFIVYVVVK